ncbi:MAG: methylmalonyl Co-A mutase-associated GTPase MeaB [Candidatus Nanopelagicales bacterium]|jgi:LAO/AO transport system kinase|nr:methylmalonyl Co-A mutase-associated GTPase MeaB [Candidatus Nanopelagicales bacterium]MCU0298485.1 methylmalonyl Co-A mutase-associated GTPase MeaB [Candidatus Nanopelagicales bacterium]
MKQPLPATAELANLVCSGDTMWLARAITLVESRKPEHREASAELLTALMPFTGGSDRVGLTGVPGVGKSTFIDQFGTNLTADGHKVAVLAVDPSSSRTGGAILGDKTRMERLGVDPNAFIRPSPASGSLGGVARATREAILLCEAAGFDVVLVETVGVGQSETTVSEMVDIFVVLMLAGAGDELQGIKRGVLEIADLIAVNKADGDNVKRAKVAAADYRRAIHLMTSASPNWTPPVLTCSALTNDGLPQIWEQIVAHRDTLAATGEREARRQRQQIGWMWSLIGDRLLDEFKGSPKVRARLASVEASVLAGELPPAVAADALLATFLG